VCVGENTRLEGVRVCLCVGALHRSVVHTDRVSDRHRNRGGDGDGDGDGAGDGDGELDRERHTHTHKHHHKHISPHCARSHCCNSKRTEYACMQMYTHTHTRIPPLNSSPCPLPPHPARFLPKPRPHTPLRSAATSQGQARGCVCVGWGMQRCAASDGTRTRMTCADGTCAGAGDEQQTQRKRGDSYATAATSAL